METIPIENLLRKTGSIYKLCVLASKRATELSSGSAKLVDARPDTKVAVVALNEIANGKVTFKKPGK